MAVLSGNTMFRELDAAGQSSGEMTPHPTVSVCPELTSTWRKWALLESASRSSERGVRGSLAQCLGHDVEGGGLRPRHLQGVLQAGPEGDSPCDVGLNGITSGLLTLDPEGVPCDESDCGSCDGETDDDGPQEFVPGTTGRRMRLVGRYDEMSADGVLQGGERCVERLLGFLLDLCQVCGLWRLLPAGQKRAQAVLCGDEGSHSARQVRREAGVARCREQVFEASEGLVRGLGVAFGRVHQCGWRRALAESLRREDLERRRRSAEIPDGTLENEIPLRHFRGQRFGLGGVGNAEEGPCQRDNGDDDAHENDRPVGRIPVPALLRGRVQVPGDGGGPSAHGTTYRRVRAIS